MSPRDRRAKPGPLDASRAKRERAGSSAAGEGPRAGSAGRGGAARPVKVDPKDRLRRVLFLVPYAVRHPGIPVKELARKCGVTEKELVDDLEFLLGVGAPPFAPDDFLDLYVEGERVYVALHQSFSRPPRFTESEAAALAAAAQGLGGEGRERVVRVLRESVPRDRRASFDELVGRIYAGSPPAKDSVLGKLQRAIAEHRAVRVEHQSYGQPAARERVVQPWTLAQRLGHWYLYGHDEARGRAIAFRVDRILDCAVTDARFEPPSDAELARARLFSDAGGEPIRIRLAPTAAEWALARPGALRVVKRSDREGAVVEVAGVSEEWATRFALSFGGEAEVVAPASARRLFSDAVRATLARYG